MTNTNTKAINLTGVAKGSIEELIGDLEDYVRQNSLRLWDKSDRRVEVLRRKAAELVRNLSNLSSLSLLSDLRGENKLLSQFVLSKDAEEASNLLLTLCHQATYLLHRQVDALKNKHMREGGLSSRTHPFSSPLERGTWGV